MEKVERVWYFYIIVWERNGSEWSNRETNTWERLGRRVHKVDEETVRFCVRR